MKIKVLLIYFIAMLLVHCKEPVKKATIDGRLSSVSQFIDLDDQPVSLDEFKGKKILLNFWATWCVPCLKEMPSMAEAQKILENEDFVFLFATTDPKAKILTFKEKNDYPFKYLRYTGTLDKLNIYALPSTFIYNSKGKIAQRIDGATAWDSDEMITNLKKIK